MAPSPRQAPSYARLPAPGHLLPEGAPYFPSHPRTILLHSSWGDLSKKGNWVTTLLCLKPIMASPGIKKKKKNPNSLSCYPKSKLHNMSLWEDKLGKGIPSCGLTAATQTEQFGNCEPLCSAQPLQLYWDALHEALSDPGPTLFKLKLFLPLGHLSYLSHTALSDSILKYAKLFCLWPLRILFPLPGRVLVRLMPPTSDLLNITSLRKRDFPDLIKSSSLSPLLFILRPLFFFLYSIYSQLVIILTSIVSAFCLSKAGKLSCVTLYLQGLTQPGTQQLLNTPECPLGTNSAQG